MSNATVSVYPFDQTLAPATAVAKTRLGWVDVARGITILLVVMGHANLPYQIQSFLQPFRLPLFYFTAGYIFNYERHRDALGNYLSQRLRRLVPPYFCTAAFFYFVWLVVSNYTHQDWAYDPVKQLAGIFLASGMSHGTGDYVIRFDLALWFLGCMAVSTVIFVELLHFFRNEGSHVPLLMASAGVACLGRVIGDYVALPWSADVAMIAQFFFVMGFLLRRHGTTFQDARILVFMFALYFALYWTGDLTDMNHRIYPDFSKFILAGLAGTYVVFAISKKIAQLAETEVGARHVSAGLEFLGRNTMVIMAFHMGGNYLRDLFEEQVLGRIPAYPSPFWPTFLWLSLASMLAIVVLNRVPALKRIYYK